MQDIIKKLAADAVKGDREAQKELLELAKRMHEAGDLDTAVVAYEESAVAYRIEAFRQRARLDDVSLVLNSQINKMKYFEILVKDGAHLRYSFPIEGIESGHDTTASMNLNAVLLDDDLKPLIEPLNEVMLNHNFNSGSILRRIRVCVGYAYGSQSPRCKWLFRDPEFIFWFSPFFEKVDQILNMEKD